VGKNFEEKMMGAVENGGIKRHNTIRFRFWHNKVTNGKVVEI
jgi:hypothetical protein